MRRIVLTFGFIAGGILAAIMFLTLPFHERIGGGTGMVIGYTSMVLASLMIYVGIRQYRDTVLGGRISYWQGLKVGLLISGIAVACYVVAWEILYYGFMPDFADKYAASAVEALRATGAAEAQIAAKTAEMARFAEMYRNPLVNIAFTILEPLPVVLLFSLVSAGLLRTKSPPTAG